MLAATPLTGCTGGGVGGDGPPPEETVAALADALEAGDLSAADGVRFTTPTAQVARDHQQVVEGMAGLQPTVDPAEVRQDGDSATATLSWTWPVAGEEWRYQTSVRLTRADGEWQAAWGHEVVEPSLGSAAVLDLTPIAARRGDIVGAGGRDIMTERPVIRVGIDRSQVPKTRAADSARRLAQLVGIDVAPYVASARAAGELAFVEAITYRADEVPPAVGQGFDEIPGARLVGDDLALAPTRDFAAPILGRVGEVTAEMVKADPDRYQVGDEAGLSGLQQRYDEQLQGVPGAVVNAVGSDGNERELFRVEARTGRPLRITMDLDLQQAAESLLADVLPASALVAVRPSTGAILVAANGPGTGGYNIATFGQYAPGSTFKSVSSLALLRAGLGPQSTVSCPSSMVVDGKRFGNYSDYPTSALGRIPFRTAVANSCNTAFVSEADRLGELDLFDAAASLGMGIDHDLGFPAYFGQVEPAASGTEAAADMIGQGRILASPMVMATVIASVQRGEVVVPRLVESVDVSPPDAEPLTAQEAAALRGLLRGVVTSGSGRGLLDVPGPPVIAKTGTAEFETESGRIDTHAWMIAAQGDLAVAAFVEVGESGSSTAGPILEAFLRAAR